MTPDPYGRAPADPTATRVRPPLPDLLSLLLLLATLAPAGIVFGQLGFWSRFQPPWPAFLCGAFCCGLAAMNRRAGWWLLVAVALGAAAVYATVYRAQPGLDYLLRDEQTRAQLLRWFDQIRDGARIHDDLAVNAWTTAAAWLAGMWAAWAALRAGRHWLVLAAAGALLATSIGYQKGWPAVGLVPFTFAALLLLARLNHRRLQADAAARGVPLVEGGAVAWAPHVALVGAGAAGLVALAFAIPAARWRVGNLIVHSNGNGSHAGVLGHDALSPQTALHDFGSTMTFHGAVELGDQTVATAKAAAPGYLFGVAYDTYTSSGWSSTAVAQQRMLAPLTQAPAPQGQGVPAGRLERLAAAGADTAGVPYADSEAVGVTVNPVQPTSVLLAAGPPLTVTTAINSALGTSAPRHNSSQAVPYVPQSVRDAPRSEISALLALPPLQSGSSYTTSGLVSHASAASLAQDNAPLEPWLEANYTRLPATVPQRVRDLAQRLTSRAHNDYDRARAVQAYLRTLPYDTNIPAPPSGEDGVDYLLFGAGRGYCDYFAAAMAVLLRSAGVPARVVVGYVMHERSGDGFIVRDRDAHAWTEVYFPTYGWLRFDPTPGGAAAYAQAASLALAPDAASQTTSANAPAVATPAVSNAPDAAAVPAGVGGVRSGRSRLAHVPSAVRLLAPVVALALAAGVTAYVCSRLRRPRSAAFAAWRGSTLLGGLLFRPPRIGETPSEYASAVNESVRGTEGLRHVAHAFSRARYGPDDGRMPHGARLWRRTGAYALALLRSRFRRRSDGGQA